MDKLYEKILADILVEYFEFDEEAFDFFLENGFVTEKERISRIKNMEVRIYPNDHNPPHFHVISADYKVNAKFLIETGEYLSGQISTKNLNRINVFWKDPKTKIVMEKVWKKYQG